MLKKRKAVYAASFDPIINGHLNVIERMAPLYDELIVVIAVDARKEYMFTPQERMEMVQISVAHIPHVAVDVCIGHYVVKMAETLGAQIIIRGLRNFQDLESEQVLAEENRKICPGLETIFVPCLPELMHVSSSMIKGHVGIDPEWEEQVARSAPEAVVAKLKEKFIVTRAGKHWVSLMSYLGNPKNADDVFKGVVARYGKPGRYYHTLEHIVGMLDELFGVGSDELRLAIWFHDIMDDEEESAAFAKNVCEKWGLKSSLCRSVYKLILATTHETPPTGRAKLLTDLDLAILGKPEKEFDKYEEEVRKEYSFVPDDIFSQKRMEILQYFLSRDFIYSTKRLREKYEDTARKNLERSIRKLEQKS